VRQRDELAAYVQHQDERVKRWLEERPS